MEIDQIVHSRVAQMLGDALIRQTTFAAEAEVLRQQVAAMLKQLAEAETDSREVAEAGGGVNNRKSSGVCL